MDQNATPILGPPPAPQPFPSPSPPTAADFTILGPPPPPFPAPPRTVDLSSLEFVLALIAIITIPALIYTFVFAIKCPPNPFRRRDRSHDERGLDDNSENINNNTESISGVKYQKDAHVKDIGSECPVCLSVFADGEDVRQLSVCKHSFHASCIDMWLNSHSNCPICRASVAVKRPNNGRVSGRNNDDLQQGLPDAGSLV